MIKDGETVDIKVIIVQLIRLHLFHKLFDVSEKIIPHKIVKLFIANELLLQTLFQYLLKTVYAQIYFSVQLTVAPVFIL